MVDKTGQDRLVATIRSVLTPIHTIHNVFHHHPVLLVQLRRALLKAVHQQVLPPIQLHHQAQLHYQAQPHRLTVSIVALRMRPSQK